MPGVTDREVVPNVGRTGLILLERYAGYKAGVKEGRHLVLVLRFFDHGSS